MSAWAVIPTYDEAENVEAVVAAVRSLLPHVLVVDDGSPDGTGLIADELARRDRGVHVLHRATKDGLAAAYVAGMDHALRRRASAVVQLDADLSHDPADLQRLLAALADADVVLGSRYAPGGRTDGWPLRRRLVSRGGGRYAALVLGLHGVSDPTGGFKAWRADALRAVLAAGPPRTAGYAFQIETTHRAARLGLRIAEVPITFRDRTRGASKMGAGIALEALWRVPLLGLDRPAAARPGAHPAVDHVPHLAGAVPLDQRRARRRPLP